MKIFILIAILLFCTPCLAETLTDSINDIEQSWATIYYDTAKPNQAAAYNKLLAKVDKLTEQHPDHPALIYWRAVTLACQAEHMGMLSALEAIQNARGLLEKAIAMDPKTMNGSALVMLGTIYYKTPQWPIAFGDNNKAEQLLQAALKINPTGIDANYFYGDFLLSIYRPGEAEKYFVRALAAPGAITYTESHLQAEAKAALKKAQAATD